MIYSLKSNCKPLLLQLDDEMKRYLQEHPELNKMVHNAQQLDQQTENALHIDVPEGLEARILVNQSYKVNQTVEKTSSPPIVQAKGWKSWSAMAASFLVVAIGIGVWQERATLFPLKATDVIAHVVHHMEDESDFMKVDKPPTSVQELQLTLFSRWCNPRSPH